MREESKVDLGSIQVHKKVLADITYAALQDIDGIRLMEKDFKSQLCDLVGIKLQPGISVTVDSANQVVIEVRIFVQYGINIPDMAGKIQDVVREAVERAVDINLRDVNVNVQGIERGES